MPCSCGSLECNCQRRCRCRYTYCLCVPCYLIQGNRCHLCGLPSFHRSSSSPNGWCNCFISESHISPHDNLNSNVDRNVYNGNMFARDNDQPLPTASLDVQRTFFEQGTYFESQSSEADELSSSLDVLAVEYHKDERSNLEVEYLPIIPMEQTEVVTLDQSSDIIPPPRERGSQTNADSSLFDTSRNARTFEFSTSSRNQIDSEVTDLIKSLNECFRRQNARNENKIGRIFDNTRKGAKFSKQSNSGHKNVRIFTNSDYKNKSIRLPSSLPPVRPNASNRPIMSNPGISSPYGMVNYIHPAYATHLTRPTISSIPIAIPHFIPNNFYRPPVSSSSMQSHTFAGLHFQQNIPTIQPILNPRIIGNRSLRFTRPEHSGNQAFIARCNILNWMNNSNLNARPPNSTAQFSDYTSSYNEPNTSDSAFSNTEVNAFRNEHNENAATSVVEFRSSQYENAAVASNCVLSENLQPDRIGDPTSNMLSNVIVSKYLYEHDESSVANQTSSPDSVLLELEDTDDSDSIKASSNKSFKIKLGIDNENRPSSKLDSETTLDNKKHEKEYIPSAIGTEIKEFKRIYGNKTAQSAHSTLIQGADVTAFKSDISLQNNKFGDSNKLGNTKNTAFNRVGNSFYSSSIKITVPSFAVSEGIMESSKAIKDMKTTEPLNLVSDSPDVIREHNLPESVKPTTFSSHASSSLKEHNTFVMPEGTETNPFLNQVSDQQDVPEVYNLQESVKPTVSLTHASSSRHDHDSSVTLKDMEKEAPLN